jgi:succinoglycan biosynthesis protein ExoI
VGALLLGLLIASSAWADTLSGRATLLDGDTIEIAGERIRLHGIDAPESGQQCQNADARRGRAARRFLSL